MYTNTLKFYIYSNSIFVVAVKLFPTAKHYVNLLRSSFELTTLQAEGTCQLTLQGEDGSGSARQIFAI